MKTMKKVISFLLVAVMIFSMMSVFAVSSSAATPLTHLVQTESKWKYYIGGGTLYDTGCGIFSMRNAIGYLTGYDIGIDAPARWAHSIGAYNVTGGEGTYRLVLYPKITAKYGSVAGFKVINESTWGTAANTTLKAHLANGGVAIGHVPGHFIALVDYDYNTNKFHVLDSAPSTARGTTSGYGDCWVTESRLSTGKLDLDWFCLLSATGTPADEQDNEKGLLATAISNAEDERYYDYSETGINTLRTAYSNAVSVYNDSNSTSADYESARETLEAAMESSTVSVISTGKSYTTTEAFNPSGSQADNGVKLTDGDKGNSDGGTEEFFGAKGCEVVVDLGSVQNSNIYKIYMTAGDWGVAVPYGDQLQMEILTSTNGTNYTSVTTANNAIRTGVKNGNWETVTLTATLDTAVSARYVKFIINSTATNNFVWIDEVEVLSGEPLLSGHVYINGMNEKVGSGDCIVYTPSFGEITVSTANHAYTANIVAKWDQSQYAYVVTDKFYGEGTATKSVTLTDGEIMIAAHNWETGITDGTAIAGSAANANTLYALQIGDVIKLDGVDTYTVAMSVACYAKIVSSAAVETPEVHVHTPGEETCTGGQVCLGCGEVLKEAEGHDNGIWSIEENLKVRKCTKCDETLESEEIVIDGVGDVKYVLGDVNNDGSLSATDYMMLKKVVFASMDVSDLKEPDTAELRSDMNGDGKFTATDYFMLKKAIFA